MRFVFMGSTEFFPCSFCDYWVHHPYTIDGPLSLEPSVQTYIAFCRWCWEFVCEKGRVGSREHWWSRKRWSLDHQIPPWLDHFFPRMPADVKSKLADMLAPLDHFFPWMPAWLASIGYKPFYLGPEEGVRILNDSFYPGPEGVRIPNDSLGTSFLEAMD